ncbi:MAG TPA: cytochrome c oxidase subunit II [Thermoanaerobaculia bacterium]
MRRALVLLSPCALFAGCRYATLDRATPEGSRITDLHWFMFWLFGAVFFAVMGSLAAALMRRGGVFSPEGERRRSAAVIWGAAVSCVLLLVTLGASVWAGREVATPTGPDTLEIRVIGHQWWWEVRYPAAVAAQEFTTANEIHVPVGRAVRFLLGSDDVIHSFWAPNLNGKKDLLPGRSTTESFRVERAGTYPGRCAEFCGYQHAHMGFVVIAEPPERFDAWLAGQRRDAEEPSNETQRHGLAVFLSGPCVTCHTIRGAGAFGHRGPDLTHLASRSTIAADTLPNTTGHLAGWIVDSQRLKPGNRMPPNLIPSGDLLDLVAYLRGLR